MTLEQRLDRLISGFAIAEGQRRSTAELTERFPYSCAHTYRLFKNRFGEAPGQFRRRLILERSAEQVAFGADPIWKVAVDSGFACSESFVRAFARAYGINPGAFRAKGCGSTWLPSPSTLHYWKGTIVSSVSQGEPTMNLSERIIEHDLWLTGALLEQAGKLSEEQLDAELDAHVQLMCFDAAETTLRDLLHSLVFTKEVWLGAIYSRSFPDNQDKSIAGLQARWAAADTEFRTLAREVNADGRWDDLFVDGLCTPPETFSFGGVFAHILTHSAVRRALALRELRRLGVDELGFGDPIDWERSLSKA